MQRYVDSVWEAVPEGAEPERFAERRRFLLDRVAAGQRVLDVGCGEGFFAQALLEHGAEPVAVDVAAEPLRRLRARFPAVADARQAPPEGPLPLADDEVDAVWAGEVLEHVVDVGAWLAEVRRVLRPGGRLLLTTPDHPRRLLLRLALSPRAFDEHFSPYADHLRFFSRRTLRGVLEDAGFAGVGVAGARGTLLVSAT
jgi:SAM-dependent methyltransferase